MFLGHLGTGFGAKAAAPKVSLGTLLLAAVLVDLIWPTLIFLGIELVEIRPGATRVMPLDFVHYPISHSLVAVLVWAGFFSLVYFLARSYKRGAIVVGALALGHWLLDAIVHIPDLPLVPGSDLRAGLGLWQSIWGTLLIELGIFAVGVWLYVRSTRALDRIGNLGLWALVGLLLLIYAGNFLGGPPPSVAAVAWVGQAQWLIVLWGYWVDRHRQPA
jgi:uncharacterized membrane protein